MYFASSGAAPIVDGAIVLRACHVESPRRNVDELATPDPSRAVAIVPLVTWEASIAISSAPPFSCRLAWFGRSDAVAIDSTPVVVVFFNRPVARAPKACSFDRPLDAVCTI